jgi:hypothetical protein
MIHSTRKVAEQLGLSLDVKLSLQCLYHKIEKTESEEFLKNSNDYSNRAMTKLSVGYADGTIALSVLTDNEYKEMKKLSSTVRKEVKTFDKLFINNFLLHTVHYCDGEGKHIIPIVFLKQIQKLADHLSLGTVALIKPLQKTQSHKLKTSGEPCREVLKLYAQTPIISRFIAELNPISNIPVVAVLVQNIIANCILVTTSESTLSYIVKLPNNYEHH